MPYGFNEDKSIYTLDDLIALLNGERRIVFKNAVEIFGTKSDGVSERQIMGLNASNQLVIGYGGYQQSDIPTVIEGNDVTLLTKGTINLRKGNTIVDAAPTDWAYLVGSASVANYVRYRKVSGICFVEVNYSSGAGLSTTNKKFATMPTGFRPSKSVIVMPNTDQDNLSKMWINTAGEIYAKMISGTATVLQGTVVYPIG